MNCYTASAKLTQSLSKEITCARRSLYVQVLVLRANCRRRMTRSLRVKDQKMTTKKKTKRKGAETDEAEAEEEAKEETERLEHPTGKLCMLTCTRCRGIGGTAHVARQTGSARGVGVRAVERRADGPFAFDCREQSSVESTSPKHGLRGGNKDVTPG